MLHLIDRLASRWLSFRTDEAVKKTRASGEGVEFHKASIENGEIEMLMMAPGVFGLASDCAALLNSKNAQNYIEIDMMPRIDRALKPIRLTIQWADGQSPARKAAKLQGELEELRKEMDAIRFAAHMPDDYAFGLPSWINQRLYLSYIGGYFSPEVMEEINTGRTTFPDAPANRERDEAIFEMAHMRNQLAEEHRHYVRLIDECRGLRESAQQAREALYAAWRCITASHHDEYVSAEAALAALDAALEVNK